MTRCTCMPVLVPALVLAPIAAAGETETYWIGPGGDFGAPASWNGPVPDETVTCIFDFDADPGPFVFFNADAVSSRLVVRAGNPEFYMWDSDGQGGAVSRQYGVVNNSFYTPSVVIAENPSETATLLLREGYLDAQSVVLGMGEGSYGALAFHTGLFDLAAGLTCAYELHVGGAGQGLLTIDQAIEVTASEAVLGVSTDGLGEILLTEPGSRLDVNGPLTVGKQGQGFLTVDDQADLTSAAAMIGMQPGGHGEVALAGQGATWVSDGSLEVGFQGEGSLSVTGGAVLVTHGFAAIGSFNVPSEPGTGGVGDVTINGPASLWLVDDDLYVGLQGIGTMDILDGATVISQGGIVGLFAPRGNVANVEGPGSVWSATDGITVSPVSLLRVVQGAIVLAPTVDVQGDLDADGTILGDLEVAGVTRVGDPVGTLVVQGDMTTGTEVLVDLAGPMPGAYDAVAVTGVASVGGTLTVSLAGGYEPQLGDAFSVLAADVGVNGAFDTVTLPDLASGLTWFVVQSTESIDLTVVLDLPGDLDGDGIIGIGDFLQLLAAWGDCPAPPADCPADLNGDGMVGINDMLMLLSLWS